ncbi:MAG: FAD-dependent oxidoreductase [Candidatus Woesearchaeota archaeon]
MKVVIVGGGSGGTACAFELRKLNKDVDITIIEKNNYLYYSPCAIPYVLTGEIKNIRDIFLFKESDYKNNRINIMLNCEVFDIDSDKKKVFYSKKGKKESIEYDKLVIATGASNLTPQVEGIEKTEYFTLKDIDDAKKILKNIKKGSVSAVIGAGIVGMELAVCLRKRGEKVFILEEKEHILPNMLDKTISNFVKQYLEKEGIKIYEGKKIKKIKENNLIIGERKIKFDKLFICTGNKPNIEIAKKAHLEINKAILVNEFLETSKKDIYACGDSVEFFEFNTNEKIVSGLGTTAVRQARVIAKNILGGKEKFNPIMNNSIAKIGNLYVGSVGLTEKRAIYLGKRVFAADYCSNVRAEYYPSKEKIIVRIVGDEKGSIIGGQIAGESEVVGRLDLLALAIQNKNHLSEIENLETCYNPPSSPIFEPLSIVAGLCIKKILLNNN